ncbi:gamma-glutamylcyclotransferase family protein [Microvirga alba]|uniref:Gamma-glutamylcyclotransferase n=1 Tax=Microvirga alba TaxID=2791025 RepID=A0A931FNN3_9HYPH|nr:gamma-glutamylcyclotransferase family protein [Microvirga alba]MBF9234199.1 gamma-glutamylcyclotransferase [Microvirga alba]
MPLYFAYGSNMDQADMAKRCPGSKVVGVGRLMRHRFVIFDGGYASVVRDPQRAVWGVVWDLALGDVPALDRYENLSTGLYTKVIQPVLTPQGPRRAIVYVARSAKPGTPKPGYMEGVVAAAEEAGLPKDYIHGLAALLPHVQPSSPPEQPKVRPRWSSPANVSRKPSEL